MKQLSIRVPRGIRYISEWEDYVFPKGHCIVDKGVTGCGYTEYCLTNSRNIVLCSPRKLLLENKRDQHKDDINILYLENGIDGFQGVKEFRKSLETHLFLCREENEPVKFLVTYDSLHYISEYLEELGIESQFTFVVDEFQSIFMDAFFKSDVEFDFVKYLQGCPNVIYLSATPMLDKYLEKVDEFKDLLFYRLNWDDSGYVERMRILRSRSSSLGSDCGKIIDEYLSGKFKISVNQLGKPIESKEAVFYFNSVSEIIRIVKSRNLTPDNTLILCSDQDTNKKRLKKIGFEIGRVPLKDELRKMFTFCTRSVYVGVDFHSDNARTFVFSDPNLKTTATDIRMDLPQIAGRQRNIENPFKNEITLFYKTIRKDNFESEEDFKRIQNERKESTEVLLREFSNMTESGKKLYLKRLNDFIISHNYSDDFVGISAKTGLPVYNKFIEIAYERAWEVAQKDYQDNISVTKALISQIGEDNLGDYFSEEDQILQDFLDNHFYATGLFHEKMRMYCEFMDKYKSSRYIVESLLYKIPDTRFKVYYEFFGTSGCKSRKYEELNLYRGIKNSTKEDHLSALVYLEFKPGGRYPMSYIKSKLNEFNLRLGISGKAKATDLGEYFEMTKTRITLPDKTVVNGFKIGPKKI